MAEFSYIEKYFSPLVVDEGALALHDDAALLSAPQGTQIVVTTDTIVQDVHFRSDDPASTVAVKLLGVNVSDLAAMGAAPLSYVLSVALPKDWPGPRVEEWLEAFSSGLAHAQSAFRLHLLGGDTVSTPGAVVLGATAFGAVPSGRALQRSGARPGDLIAVTGTLGDAALGLRVLRGELADLSESMRAELIDRYRRPRPRIDVGILLRGFATAAADISDGVVADLQHICDASMVSAKIDVERLPVSAAARAALSLDPKLLSSVIAGGDDYELAFTFPAELEGQLHTLADATGVSATCIGVIEPPRTPGSGPVSVLSAGQELQLKSSGFQHFS